MARLWLSKKVMLFSCFIYLVFFVIIDRLLFNISIGKMSGLSAASIDPSAPKVPAISLASRRGRHEMVGRAVAFPLLKRTTHPVLVSQIRACQQAILAVIAQDPAVRDVMALLDDGTIPKEMRREQKFWKSHKYLHLAFFASVLHGPSAGYESRKMRVSEKFEAEARLLQDLMKHELYAVPKECKLNPDGHIVVRMAIEPKEVYLHFKAQLDKLFGRTITDERHKDKVKAEPNVLASVIGVLDPSRFHDPASHEKIIGIITDLDVNLKKLGAFRLFAVQNIEYNKRTFSPKSHDSTREFTRDTVASKAKYVLPLCEAVFVGGSGSEAKEEPAL